MGLFKSTRYRHFHTQSSSLMNDGFLPDPISTYAGMAVAKKDDIGNSVIRGIRNGSGAKLRSYYQYATLRYKNRNFKSSINFIVSNPRKGLKPKLDMFRPFLPTDKDIKLNDVYIDYTLGGAKHYAYMKSEYGLDMFNNEHDSMYVNLSTPVNFSSIADNTSGNSWIIGYAYGDDTEVHEDALIPVVILDPLDANENVELNVVPIMILDTKRYTPKLSRGISYLSQSKDPIIEDTVLSSEVLSDVELSTKYPSLNKEVNSILVLESNSNWDGKELTEEITFAEGKASKTTEIDTTETVNQKCILVANVEELSDTDGSKTYRYTVNTINRIIKKDFDTEEFLYETPDGQGNAIGIGVKLQLLKDTHNDYITSVDTKMFKFYPYIPIRETDNLWGGRRYNTFDYKDSKLIEYTKQQNKEFNKAVGLPDDSESAPKPSKKGFFKNFLKSHLSGGLIDIDGKFTAKGALGTTVAKNGGHHYVAAYQGEKEKMRKEWEEKRRKQEAAYALKSPESDAPNQRIYNKSRKVNNRLSVNRKLTREGTKTRKIKIHDHRQNLKRQSDSSTKRHLNKMGELLSINLYTNVASILANPSADKLARMYIMPAVNLNTTNNDVMKYWWTFFNRIYNKLEDGGYSSWINGLNNAGNINNMKLFDIAYENVANTFAGHLAFAFIQKFEIKGTIRKIKRKRDIYDIRRGKPRLNVTLEDLLLNPEPIRELANDTYYTSKQGKQYNIGGSNEFNGTGADPFSFVPLIKSVFNYTFICKQVDADTLSVIAVAGLCGRTDIGYNRFFWGSAWYDLGLQYKRNKNKYMDSESKAVYYENDYRESKRHYQHHNISTFFQVPLDYNTLRRMGGVDLERFSQRALTIYTWHEDEQKFKARWVGRVIKIVGYVIAAIIAFHSWDPTAFSTISAAIATIAEAVITTVVVNLIIKYGVLPLLKALGVKGLVALIILLVITLIASYASSYNPDISSLPYASQTATSQVASQTVKETVKTGIEQTIQQTISNMSRDLVKELSKISLRDVTKTALFSATQELQNQYVEQAQGYQDALNNENRLYTQASRELEEKSESLHQVNYDFKAVMENLRLRFKLQDPNNVLNSAIDSSDFAASYDYLVQFLDSRLDLTVETFDPINSLDFTLPLNPSTNA